MIPFRPLLEPEDFICPICGRPVYNKKCLLCNQIFYSKEELPSIDNNVLYLSISTFIGWVGMGYRYHFAFNLKSKEYAAVKVSTKNVESIMKLSTRLVQLLTAEETAMELFSPDLPSHNGTKLDNNIYYVNVQRGDRIFRISVDSDCVSSWPIFEEVINEF